MKSLKTPLVYTTIIIAVIFLLTCKTEEIKLEVEIFTGLVTNISYSNCTVGGTIGDVGAGIKQHGFCWSESSNPSIKDSKVELGAKSATGTFIGNLTNLTQNTTYYVRAFAKSNDSPVYGDAKSFTTEAYTAGIITTTDVSNVNKNSASCGGNITDDGGVPITARGVCWSTSQNPTISDSKTTDGSGTGSFTSELTNLSGETTYYVRAYAINSVDVAYGNEVSFTTISVTTPTVSTSLASDIAETSATLGGTVTSEGSATVTERGVCWSTSENPEITDNKMQVGSGMGSFSSSITGLQPTTTYHVRAYAINSEGTVYGSQVSFTTISVTTPTVSTSLASDIAETSATLGGTVTSEGSATVTERGVCWSTSENPEITDNKMQVGSGMGSFSSSITGLQPTTTYHVRAYAINSEGTVYGSQVSFTTISVTTPTVSTSLASDITETSATLGGTVTSDGNATVTERGVCWSTSENPEITDNKMQVGSGMGSFSSSITGLQPTTTYHVRAYAINSEGTVYGSQVSFITLSVTIPTVTTSPASDITGTTATLGGNVTYEGGATVTERGVYYGTFTNPEITGIKLQSIGSGTGEFTIDITGLTDGTIYYAKAYAINSIGEGLGNEVTFTAELFNNEVGYFTDTRDGRVYKWVEMGNQVWMAENLAATTYNDGTTIPLVTDNTAWANLADDNSVDACCYYNNESTSQYGVLYTYAAATNACPAGWHLPTDDEWEQLEMFIGLAEGALLKTTSGWYDNGNGTDYYNFSALPGGRRNHYPPGNFYNAGNDGTWWSNTEFESYGISAWYRRLYFSSDDIEREYQLMSAGFSVRCIKD